MIRCSLSLLTDPLSSYSCNLASVALHLKSLGVDNLLDFDFMDKPDHHTLTRALMLLFELGALSRNGSLTPLGQQMSQFPLEPTLSRMVIDASSRGCIEQILTLVAMLSTDTIFFCPQRQREQANAARRRFAHESAHCGSDRRGSAKDGFADLQKERGGRAE